MRKPRPTARQFATKALVAELLGLARYFDALGDVSKRDEMLAKIASIR